MKKQIITSGLIGGIIGSVVVVIVLMVINQFVPLKTQDMLSFIILAVSVVIAAFTILGASILFTSWNDIDERAEKSHTKYEQKAEQAINKYGNETKQEIVQEINERQVKLTEAAQEYSDKLAQDAKVALQKQKTMLSLSLMLIGGAMIGTYLHQRVPFSKFLHWWKTKAK